MAYDEPDIVYSIKRVLEVNGFVIDSYDTTFVLNILFSPSHLTIGADACMRKLYRFS